MKMVAVLIALLVASAGFAAAQDTTPRDQPDEPEETEAGDDAPDQPEDPPKRDKPEDSTPDKPPDRENAPDEPKRPEAEDPNEADESDEESGGDDSELRYIDAEPTRFGLESFEVQDRSLIDSLSLGSEGKWQKDGKRVLFVSESGRLILHDNPTGLMTFQGKGPVRIVFEDDVQITVEGSTANLVVDSRQFVLSVASGSWDGQLLVAKEGFKLHVDPEPFRGNADRDDDQPPVKAAKVKAAFDKAQRDGHVGAEVNLKSRDNGVYLYDDVEVQLTVPAKKATAADPIRIQVGANLTEGRTIVIDLDPSMLESNELTLRYFDVFETSTGQINREVSFNKASSLEDVLDPTNDEGPEWWIVEDENGMQLIASIDHWSVHAIEIASEVIPGIIIGVVIGLGSTMIAAVVMLRPRKED